MMIKAMTGDNGDDDNDKWGWWHLEKVMIKEIQRNQLLQLADLLLTPEQPHDFIENVDDQDEDACGL